MELNLQNFHYMILNKYKDNIKIIEKIKRKKYIKKNNLKSFSENNIIKWDYEYEDIFKCRVDKKNEINVYYIHSFMGKNRDSFYDKIEKCTKLFDKNKYPITLISDFNGGGDALISLLLIEAISPLITVKFYLSIRKTDEIEKLNKEYKGVVYNEKTCENIFLEDLFNQGKKIDYGNGISESISHPFNVYNKTYRKYLETIKSKIRNKRKPTDILIIADGFSYSATSVFLKYLQYYGGGITVGYFGHPGKKNIPFDSSLSPSPLIQNQSLYIMNKEYKKLWDNYKFNMQFAYMQSFYNPNNVNIPLEYVLTPVDESKPFYEFYSNKNYQDFIKIAKDIHEKYKKQCNPKNKKLVKVSRECDKYFNNNYTHGGYECGDDGKWSNKCVASYCNLGYMFDYLEEKCVKDNCSDFKEEEEEEDDDNDERLSTTELILFICASAIIAIIIIIIIVLFFVNKNKKKSPEELLSSISMSKQDRENEDNN